ncbi:hypothetical protein [Paenibacillus doosanensis]|uniref:hypothetical protein n=1 Tax=Paenibacillus doosanensis TaxID=1229154 RepID=UPI00217F88A1|nr:hypothetical protein [Paenibacillus doosanensis]
MSLVKRCIVITKKCVTKVQPRKKKPHKPSKPLLQRFRELSRRFRLFRLLVIRRINRLTRAVNRVTAAVNNLQEEVSALVASNESIKNLLLSRVGTTVSIETISGPVSGKLLGVGKDFAQILEPTGDNVLIPIINITSVNL